MTDAAAVEILEAVRFQQVAAEYGGSALYARLLDSVAGDVEAGGVCRSALAGGNGDAIASALVLRFLAAVHRLVLAGRAASLAAYYPSATVAPAEGDPWPAFRDVVAANLPEIQWLTQRPCQTNDPGRSAGLVGGFLTVAQRTRLPLRVLEIGASAGLNLRWDRYFYDAGDSTWGDAGSPVRLAGFDGHLPFDVAAEVVERRGCDPQPLDPLDPDVQLSLRASVWPDQLDRHARLRAALDVATRIEAVVERAPASTWLAEQLAVPIRDQATVVFHSVVMQYLTAEERRAVVDIRTDAAARATRDAPLAWLSLEPPSWSSGTSGPPDRFRVRLRMWPGGDDELLALCGPHGPPVEWTAPR